MADEAFPPRRYPGVMVSSTFNDLKQHRAALIRAIAAHEMKPIAMEQDAALPVTVIDSSLRKVRDASAYIGLVSHRYGQVPDSAERNPEALSLTELEFREAQRLGRPMLIFIMGADHDVKPADVERDPDKFRKLEAFREQVKRSAGDAGVQRVHKEFNSLREFESVAMQSAAALRRHLDESSPPGAAESRAAYDGVPRPPALYAEPRYIGSHSFTGRQAELETLSAWAALSEPHPVLLYEAIGGTGKSMLTWEWMVNHAAGARTDWAGRFWYSFYERGADMADFCRSALAYMTGQPLAELRQRKQFELNGLLLRQLQSRPWLLVLDGLERVLVAYHRFDAAQVADENAGILDLIARRDPSRAIRPLDDDLLRSLAGASPSKVLITSRLVPRVLLNPSGQAVPGVLYQRLPGLQPADAEALVRACGVRGDSHLIQNYLRRHCDCHPLVSGIVAGLVNDYFPDRGNFDAWARDPGYGGHLNLAELDLVQKRNHILQTAIAALPDESRELLSTLALLSEAVDYDILAALNPYLPEEERARPDPADEQRDDRGKAGDQPPRRASVSSPESQAAARQLADAVRDMERRGLLQYDRLTSSYDLHPVVRGFASGRLRAEERARLGQRAVDYFSTKAENPYAEAETLEDVSDGLRLVRALLQIGKMEEALEVYHRDLTVPLDYNLAAYPEILSLLRPFFGKDWASLVDDLEDISPMEASFLVCDAALSLEKIGQLDEALAGQTAALGIDLRAQNERYVLVSLRYIFGILVAQRRLARAEAIAVLEMELASIVSAGNGVALADRDYFILVSRMGNWAEAAATWPSFDPRRVNTSEDSYEGSNSLAEYADFEFRRGSLTEEILARAEAAASKARNRYRTRLLLALRGRWHLDQGEPGYAADSLHEAVRLTHEAGVNDAAPEADLALARLRLGHGEDSAREEAARLAADPNPPHLELARLWQALGASEEAAAQALAAYREAWADGPPYVDRYRLDLATALLDQLGLPIPDLPPFDPASDPPLPFESEVRELISAPAEARAVRRPPVPGSDRPAPRRLGITRRFLPPRRET